MGAFSDPVNEKAQIITPESTQYSILVPAQLSLQL